jgi:uncharacterized membrane protein YhaH (DUF805 family)
MSMINSIRRNLSMLVDFSGRLDRGAFWPYAGAVLVLLTAGMMALIVPATIGAILRMQQFAADHIRRGGLAAAAR